MRQDRWRIANILMRARDAKGNLIIAPKGQDAPVLDAREEWFALRRQLGMAEWQIQAVWDEYERAAMNGGQQGTT